MIAARSVRTPPWMIVVTPGGEARMPPIEGNVVEKKSETSRPCWLRAKKATWPGSDGAIATPGSGSSGARSLLMVTTLSQAAPPPATSVINMAARSSVIAATVSFVLSSGQNADGLPTKIADGDGGAGSAVQ